MGAENNPRRSGRRRTAISVSAFGLSLRAGRSTAYGCGLRVSEIANLKVADIDSARMLIRVEQGKGRKLPPRSASHPHHPGKRPAKSP